MLGQGLARPIRAGRSKRRPGCGGITGFSWAAAWTRRWERVEGGATNLNLITASGNVYSFVLSEGGGEPDLKVYVVPDESLEPSLAAPARYYSAAEVDELRRTIDDLRGQAQEAREAAARAVEEAASAQLAADRSIEEGVAAFRSRYPSSLQFQYRFDVDETFGDSYRQAAGASLATSTGRVLDRYLNVLPTVTIREGYLYAQQILNALNTGDPLGAAYRQRIDPLDLPTDVLARMPPSLQRRLRRIASSLQKRFGRPARTRVP